MAALVVSLMPLGASMAVGKATGPEGPDQACIPLGLPLHSKRSRRFPAILNPGSPGARASQRQEALEVT